MRVEYARRGDLEETTVMIKQLTFAKNGRFREPRLRDARSRAWRCQKPRAKSLEFWQVFDRMKCRAGENMMMDDEAVLVDSGLSQEIEVDGYLFKINIIRLEDETTLDARGRG